MSQVHSITRQYEKQEGIAENAWKAKKKRTFTESRPLSLRRDEVIPPYEIIKRPVRYILRADRVVRPYEVRGSYPGGVWSRRPTDVYRTRTVIRKKRTAYRRFFSRFFSGWRR